MDGEQAQQARSIAATTGHRSLVRGDERRRMHRLSIKYHGNDNYPVWFSRDPGQEKTRRIDDQETAMLANKNLAGQITIGDSGSFCGRR